MTTISAQALYNSYLSLQTTSQFSKHLHRCYVMFVSNWGNAQCILVRGKRGSSQRRALWSAENEALPQRRALWSAESEAKNHRKISNFPTFFLCLDYELLLRSRLLRSNYELLLRSLHSLRSNYELLLRSLRSLRGNYVQFFCENASPPYENRISVRIRA